MPEKKALSSIMCTYRAEKPHPIFKLSANKYHNTDIRKPLCDISLIFPLCDISLIFQ